MEKTIAVSACLLGYQCKYDNTDNFSSKVIRKLGGYKIVPICPEQLGGMTTPRIPSEIQKDGITVLNAHGQDVTAFFERGAKATLLILQQEGCTQAILKENSPSCGVHHVYDGSFTHTLTQGIGVTAKYLKENGIEIRSDLEEGEL